MAHLIHIGYPKAGSNLLREWFTAHPQIRFADGGIAGFTSVYEIARHSAGARPDHRLAVTSSEGLASPHEHVGIAAGGRAPGARLSPDEQARACATLGSVFPAAHVLLVTRGFRSILLSGYSQYLRAGGDIDLYAGRSENPPDTSWAWNYDLLTALYADAFGDRLIVMPYELLRDDPDEFASALERRFGLAHHPMPRSRANPSLSPVELRWYPRIARLVGAAPVGARLRPRVRRLYVRAAMRNRLRPLIRMLQTVRPAEPLVPGLVTDAMLEPYRGQADSLRDVPYYQPYLGDYLIDARAASEA